MSEQQLHPNVVKFKEFLQKNPKLVVEIRKSGRSWQEYYEKWVLLGEDDPMWEKYKETPKVKKDNSTELFQQLASFAEKVDVDKLQKQIQQVSGVIDTIQGLLGEFQRTKPPTKHPYHWYKD